MSIFDQLDKTSGSDIANDNIATKKEKTSKFKTLVSKGKAKIKAKYEEYMEQRAQLKQAEKGAYFKEKIRQAKIRGREKAKGFNLASNVQRASAPRDYAYDNAYLLGSSNKKEKRLRGWF